MHHPAKVTHQSRNHVGLPITSGWDFVHFRYQVPGQGLSRHILRFFEKKNELSGDSWISRQVYFRPILCFPRIISYFLKCYRSDPCSSVLEAIINFLRMKFFEFRTRVPYPQTRISTKQFYSRNSTSGFMAYFRFRFG